MLIQTYVSSISKLNIFHQVMVHHPLLSLWAENTDKVHPIVSLKIRSACIKLDMIESFKGSGFFVTLSLLLLDLVILPVIVLPSCLCLKCVLCWFTTAINKVFQQWWIVRLQNLHQFNVHSFSMRKTWASEKCPCFKFKLLGLVIQWTIPHIDYSIYVFNTFYTILQRGRSSESCLRKTHSVLCSCTQ